MDRIFTKYLELLEVVGSAPQTVSNNKRSFELVSEFFAWRGIAAASAQTIDLVPWVSELGTRYEASTVSRHIYCVNAAYKHASEMGLVIRNPMAYLTKHAPTVIDKLPEILTCDQIRDIHELIETEREMTIFHLLLWTGCRAFELRPLRWERSDRHSHLDFDNEQLIIFGKGGKIRMVPMHPILRSKIESWPQTGHAVLESNQRRELSHAQWGRIVTGMMERAGVHTEKRSHIFRKTLNTNLVRQHVMEPVLDALFGWSPSTVRTKHYTGVASDEVREALLKAYSNDPVVPEQRVISSPNGRRTIASDPVRTKVVSSVERVHPSGSDFVGTKVISSFNAFQPAPVQLSQSQLRWSLTRKSDGSTDYNANGISSRSVHTKLPQL